MKNRLYSSGRMRIFWTLLSVAAVFSFLTSIDVCLADKGALHVGKEDVRVSEPAQKAIIFHNGSEEILVLETDLRADKETGILMFIPFPAKPEVSLAPESCFEEINYLLKKKRLEYLRIEQDVSKGGEAEVSKEKVEEIIMHQRIGSHDISVVKVNDPMHFRDWVNSYLKRLGLPYESEYSEIESLVADYVKREIPYFVFDYADLKDVTVSVSPIAYRFRSKKVYYPLKTSNTFGGEGEIQLFFFATNYVTNPFPPSEFGILRLGSPFMFPFPDAHSFQGSTYEEVKEGEIPGLYPGIGKFFGEGPIIFQSAKYKGMLLFKNDILIPMVEDYNLKSDPYRRLIEESKTRPWYSRWGDSLEYDVNWAILQDQERILIVNSLLSREYRLPKGEKVVFKNGFSDSDRLKAEIEKVASGDLNGDGLTDAAIMLTSLKGDRRIRELTVVTQRKSKDGQVSFDQGDSILLPNDPISSPRIEFGQIVIGMAVKTGAIPTAFEKIDLRYKLVKGRLERTERK